MTLSPSDIRSLYGTSFLWMGDALSSDGTIPTFTQSEITTESKEEVQIAQTSPLVQEESPTPQAIQEVKMPNKEYFVSGNAISWKMRPSSKLVLVMPEQDFQNKLLILALRELILGNGFKSEQIGFGVYKGEEKDWNLGDTPSSTAHILLFGAKSQIPAENIQVRTFEVFPSPSLAELVLTPALQDILQEKLKTLQATPSYS